MIEDRTMPGAYEIGSAHLALYFSRRIAMPRMTATEALKSPATRRLVHEVLALADSRDIVDAIHDLEHATAVLKERLWRIAS